MVPDGVDSQRGRGGRHQGGEDQCGIRQLDSDVPELGLAVDGADQVKWNAVVPDHHQRRSHTCDKELRRQRLAVRANLGGHQLPVVRSAIKDDRRSAVRDVLPGKIFWWWTVRPCVVVGECRTRV